MTPGQCTYSSVVHGSRVDRQLRRKRENDAHEQRPQDAVHVRDPSDDAVAHVKRPRSELDLRMVPVPPPATSPPSSAPIPLGNTHKPPLDAPEDRNNVRQVQRHRRHRKDRIERNRARQVQQPGQDRDHGDEPDRAQRRLRPLGDVPEEAAVGQALVARERVHGTRRGLEGSLAHEERREADERPDEERARLAHAEDHDLYIANKGSAPVAVAKYVVLRKFGIGEMCTYVEEGRAGGAGEVLAIYGRVVVSGCKFARESGG